MRVKKMIAPIVITILMVAYYFIYFGFLITMIKGFWKYVFGVLPIILSIIMICVCFERINEIRKGEEDDISKY